MDEKIKNYLSRIGRKGGKKSKRALSPEEARLMVQLREAKKAFKSYYAQCFWSYRPDLELGIADIPWVAEQLKKYGDRQAWILAHKLCP